MRYHEWMTGNGKVTKWMWLDILYQVTVYPMICLLITVCHDLNIPWCLLGWHKSYYLQDLLPTMHHGPISSISLLVRFNVSGAIVIARCTLGITVCLLFFLDSLFRNVLLHIRVTSVANSFWNTLDNTFQISVGFVRTLSSVFILFNVLLLLADFKATKIK